SSSPSPTGSRKDGLPRGRLSLTQGSDYYIPSQDFLQEIIDARDEYTDALGRFTEQENTLDLGCCLSARLVSDLSMPFTWFESSPRLMLSPLSWTTRKGRALANGNLAMAKKARQDEFYTQWVDIEREMNA